MFVFFHLFASYFSGDGSSFAVEFEKQRFTGSEGSFPLCAVTLLAPVRPCSARNWKVQTCLINALQEWKGSWNVYFCLGYLRLNFRIYAIPDGFGLLFAELCHQRKFHHPFSPCNSIIYCISSSPVMLSLMRSGRQILSAWAAQLFSEKYLYVTSDVLGICWWFFYAWFSNLCCTCSTPETKRARTRWIQTSKGLPSLSESHF